MRRRLWNLTVAQLALLACGGDDDGGIALPEAPSAFAAAYCERVFACCEQAELGQLLAGSNVMTQAECESHVTRVFGNEFVSDTMRAAQQGRAAYDPTAMASCVEHVRADSCGELARTLRLMTLPADCAVVRRPRVPVGAACDHDFQCETLACAGAADHTDGSCTAVPSIGAPCVDGECGPDAYCDRRASMEGICTAIVAQGEPCSSALGCTTLACTGGVCAAPLCDGR